MSTDTTISAVESTQAFDTERGTTRTVVIVQHEEDAGIGRFAAPLKELGIATTAVGPGVGVEVPATLGDAHGLIVLGGSPGPNDDGSAPWLAQVRGLIREALDRGLPYLGICLGGQLLAVVSGGTVGPVRIRPELGLGRMRMTPAGETDPLIGALPRQTRSMQWHFEEVTRLPPSSVSLMASDVCPNQAFRVGPRAWGLQFHPEADATSAKNWAATDEGALVRNGLTPESVAAPFETADPELDETWIPMLRRWVSFL
ncbi:type 1 glutamine amidotransferase [Streptomyces sp. NPDC059578]|uniref:type 1 glutamine amidotransferase n=1 Tax=Streptomyces sp. NPDC059578 TaxID=3346874 RepID=UPI0036CF16F6